MLSIMFSSCLYFLYCRLYDSSLLYRYLTVAYLCCIGWLEVNSMMVSVKVGFLKIAVLKPVSVLRIDISK